MTARGRDCGPAELKVRHSFMEAAPSRYVPLDYPDRAPLLTDAGQPIRLTSNAQPCSKQIIAESGGTDCGRRTVDEFAKFGFFRTVRQTYDTNYGVTEQGRSTYANRWNIWKDAAAAAAGDRPHHARDRLLHQPRVSRRPGADGHGAHNSAELERRHEADGDVAQADRLHAQRGDPADHVEDAAGRQPDIFVLKQNSCNIQGVQDFVAKYGDLRDAAEAANGDSIDKLSKSTLRQACSRAGADDRDPAGRQPQAVHLAAQRRPSLLVPALGRPPAAAGSARAMARRRPIRRPARSSRRRRTSTARR